MTSIQFIETEQGRVVQQAAKLLTSLEFIDEIQAQEVGEIAEAVAKVLLVVFYQAETGQASLEIFQDAMQKLQDALPLRRTIN
ncbi:MAG: type I toxin-antitoxin system ptaRNA1 family toxin [Thiopseudomonas sp.]|nr:type I toxin-antitoxin system ptaRNA1 family toxin [Thiopseudomonas sp.]MCK9466485.1 type I toxin-antitoxin system ptaRNA1 family toxin [Thiopseudomonas sp.]